MYYVNYKLTLPDGSCVNFNLFGDIHNSEENTCGSEGAIHIGELPFDVANYLGERDPSQSVDYYLESPYLYYKKSGDKFQLTGNDPYARMDRALFRDLFGSDAFSEFRDREQHRRVIGEPLLRARAYVLPCLRLHHLLREANEERVEGQSAERRIDRIHQRLVDGSSDRSYQHCPPNLRIHAIDFRDGFTVNYDGESYVFHDFFWATFGQNVDRVIELVRFCQRIPVSPTLKHVVKHQELYRDLGVEQKNALVVELYRFLGALSSESQRGKGGQRPFTKWLIDDVVETDWLGEDGHVDRDYVRGHFAKLSDEQKKQPMFLFGRKIMNTQRYRLFRAIWTGESSFAEEFFSRPWLFRYLLDRSLSQLQALRDLDGDDAGDGQDGAGKTFDVFDLLSSPLFNESTERGRVTGQHLVDHVYGHIDHLVEMAFRFEQDVDHLVESCLPSEIEPEAKKMAYTVDLGEESASEPEEQPVDGGQDLEKFLGMIRQSDSTSRSTTKRRKKGPGTRLNNPLRKFFFLITNKNFNQKARAKQQLLPAYRNAIARFKGFALERIGQFDYKPFYTLGDQDRESTLEQIKGRIRTEIVVGGKSSVDRIQKNFDGVLNTFVLAMDFLTVLRMSRRMCHKYFRDCESKRTYQSGFDRPQLQGNIFYFGGMKHTFSIMKFAEFLGMEEGFRLEKRQERSQMCKIGTGPHLEFKKPEDLDRALQMMGRGDQPNRCLTIDWHWMTGC
jgi:hypothetical protein